MEKRKVMIKPQSTKQKAPRNRTITLTDAEIKYSKEKLIRINNSVSLEEVENKTICQDVFEVLDYLPNQFIDFVFVDPPYNLKSKNNKGSL